MLGVAASSSLHSRPTGTRPRSLSSRSKQSTGRGARRLILPHGATGTHGGLQILSNLQQQDKILSDCQGLIWKLTKWDVLRRNTGSRGTHSYVPRSRWSQDHLGNYLADLFATGPPPPNDATTFPRLMVLPTLP